VSAVFTCAKELGLVEYNPCKGIELKNYGERHEKYKPLSVEEIAALFALDIPPQERLILQLLMTSGARRDEVATLIWSDITTETDIMILDLTKRPEIRKNQGSRRKIPVYPKVVLPPKGKPEERLFDYKLMANGKTSNASAKLMAYIRQVTDDPLKVVHSLRGSFKDGMRNLGISKELHDFITGHGEGDVSGEYGEGMSAKVRYEAISKLPVPW
jgi:integrase